MYVKASLASTPLMSSWWGFGKSHDCYKLLIASLQKGVLLPKAGLERAWEEASNPGQAPTSLEARLRALSAAAAGGHHTL